MYNEPYWRRRLWPRRSHHGPERGDAGIRFDVRQPRDGRCRRGGFGDANGNASAALEWRLAAASFQAAHPLVRVAPNRFTGSLFDLQPGTAYEVRVTLTDPDGVAGSPQTAALRHTRRRRSPSPRCARSTCRRAATTATPGPPRRAAAHRRSARPDLAQPGDLILIQPGVYRESGERDGVGHGRPSPSCSAATGRASCSTAPTRPCTRASPGPRKATASIAHVLGFSTAHVVTEQGRLYAYDSPRRAGGAGRRRARRLLLRRARRLREVPRLGSPAATMHVARHEQAFLLDGRVVRAGREPGDPPLRHVASARASTCASDRRRRPRPAGSTSRRRRRLGEGRRPAPHRGQRDLGHGASSAGPGTWSRAAPPRQRPRVHRRHRPRQRRPPQPRPRATSTASAPAGARPPPAAHDTRPTSTTTTCPQHSDDALEPEGHCANVRISATHPRRAHGVRGGAGRAWGRPGSCATSHATATRPPASSTASRQRPQAQQRLSGRGGTAPPLPQHVRHGRRRGERGGLPDVGGGGLVRSRNNVWRERATPSKTRHHAPVPFDWDGDDLFTTGAARSSSALRRPLRRSACVPGRDEQERRASPLRPSSPTPRRASSGRSRAARSWTRRACCRASTTATTGRGPDIGAVESDPTT